MVEHNIKLALKWATKVILLVQECVVFNVEDGEANY